MKRTVQIEQNEDRTYLVHFCENGNLVTSRHYRYSSGYDETDVLQDCVRWTNEQPLNNQLAWEGDE